MVDKDFDDGNVKKEKIKIKSKKTDKEKGKRTKRIVKDNRNSSFRNNYKHYQYDYEEDFYEPYN